MKADPQDKAALQSRGKRYIEQLTAIDGWAKAQFSAIPQAKRKVLTSHDAFGYFGRAYHVTFLAPQGLSSESEASAAQVAALIKQIKADGVHTGLWRTSWTRVWCSKSLARRGATGRRTLSGSAV